jgi:TP901 family phage tail tape measure protein
MPTTFTIPSIFTAIDKVSSVVKGMGKNVENFAAKAESGVARSERIFRKLTPSISGAAKEFLSFASAAAVTAGIIGGVSFSANSLKEYEDALASFRTIVGGTDQEFSKFSTQAQIVAKETKKSSIDVVKAFESIAGLNADLAKTPEILGGVTKAAILLSKGSGDDLQKSAENLVGILNQYGLEGKEAMRVSNVLAAGQAVGASNITKSAEAFTVFGAVAKTANISVEKSNALVQVLGSKMILGSEAGHALKATLGLLQKSGVGYASGVFNINDALAESKKKYDSLRTAKEKDAFISKTFGEINKSTGIILLDNIKQFEKFTAGVTGTSEAQKAADIRSRTFTAALDELKNAWVNIITSSDKAGSALNTVKNILVFITENLDTIVKIGVNILLFFAAWKAMLIVSKIVLIGYNVALGVMGALSGAASIAIGKNAAALGAYKIVVGIVTAAQWLWNAAMMANPIGLIIIAIIAMIAVIVVVIKKYNEWGAAITFLLGPIGFVINLIQSFRRNWDMITESFKTGGVLAGFKAIGATILDAILMPLQQVFKLMTNLPGVGDFAKKAVAEIEMWRSNMGVNVNTNESGQTFTEKQAINPELLKKENQFDLLERVNNAKVDININDPNKRATAESDGNLVRVKTGSTMSWAG